MPPKTCTCSVCGQEVLKSTTSAVGDGKRACKSHEGVDEQAKKQQETQKAAHEQSMCDHSIQRIRDKRRQENSQEPGFDHAAYYKERQDRYAAKLEKMKMEALEWGHHRCWKCGCLGLPGHKYFSQMMLATEKRVMVGQSVDDERNRILAATKPLIELEIDLNKTPIHNFIYHHQIQDVIKFSGIVRLCPECIDQLGLPNPLKREINIPLETLGLMGALISADLKPIIQEELDKEKAAANG